MSLLSTEYSHTQATLCICPHHICGQIYLFIRVQALQLLTQGIKPRVWARAVSIRIHSTLGKLTIFKIGLFTRDNSLSIDLSPSLN